MKLFLLLIIPSSCDFQTSIQLLLKPDSSENSWLPGTPVFKVPRSLHGASLTVHNCSAWRGQSCCLPAGNVKANCGKQGLCPKPCSLIVLHFSILGMQLPLIHIIGRKCSGLKLAVSSLLQEGHSAKISRSMYVSHVWTRYFPFPSNVQLKTTETSLATETQRCIREHSHKLHASLCTSKAKVSCFPL